MGNRSRADAGFVRKCSAAKTLDQGADKTAGDTETGEGAGKDLAEGPADAVVIDQQHGQRRADIQDTHQGHDFFSEFGDRLDAAHDHGEQRGRHQQPGEPTIAGQHTVGATADDHQLRMGLVGLEHVARTQTGADAKDRKYDGHYFSATQTALGEPLGHVIHRAARDGAVRVFVAIFDAQRALGELGRHAQQTGDNHPEGGARSADADRHCNAGDVAQAHGARERSGERLEMVDLALVIRIGIIAPDQRKGMAEGAHLDETKVQREDDRGHHQPQDDPRKAGAWQRSEDQVDEPASRIAEDGIHLCIEVRLRQCGAGRHGGDHGDQK